LAQRPNVLSIGDTGKAADCKKGQTQV